MEKLEKILDSLLVLSYRSGDKKAFDLLVKRWHKKLCFQAYGYTKDWQIAQDLAQETWGIVLRKLPMLKNPDSFGSWIIAIVIRKTIDRLKKDTKNRQNLKNHFSEKRVFIGENDNHKEIQLLKIKEAIGKLPTDQKTVLILFYLEEYNLREISKITQVSVSTVKTRLFRARQKIKSIIKIQSHEKRD